MTLRRLVWLAGVLLLLAAAAGCGVADPAVGSAGDASAWRNVPPPVNPGGKIGTMTLVRGAEVKADAELWGFCDAVIPKPGRYRRMCPP